VIIVILVVLLFGLGSRLPNCCSCKWNLGWMANDEIWVWGQFHDYNLCWLVMLWDDPLLVSSPLPLICNSVALAGLGLDRIKQRPGLVVGLGPGCRLQSNTKKASAWLSLAKPIKHAAWPSLAGLWLARAWLPSQALQGHEIKHTHRLTQSC
jgi:hypothetical protein